MCRQLTWSCIAILLLSACNFSPKSRVIEPGQFIEGFVGGVSADEPLAAITAREVLARGGTAVDAAVALTFALSVTYPVAASLGGGGVCLVYDAATDIVEAIDFLPRAPLAGGAIAIPGTVRGVAALHSRYGRLPWSDLITPAEVLARRGHPVSRALASRLRDVQTSILGNSGLNVLFGIDGSSEILREGDPLTQIALSAVLAQIRLRGASEFYLGQAAVNLVSGARKKGGVLSLADMRASIPMWRESVSIRNERLSVYTMPAPIMGGVIAGQIWAMNLDEGRVFNTGQEERSHLFAEAASRAYMDRGNAAARPLSNFRAHTLMRSYRPDKHTRLSVEGIQPVNVENLELGTTSYVVADREGSAVACTLTMGRELGTRMFDPITGIIFVPPLTGDDLAFLSAILVIDKELGEVVLAISASGNAAAPAAIGKALVGLSLEDLNVRDQLDQSRILHLGQPDVTLVEPGIDASVSKSLRAREHILREVPLLQGRVNAIHCPNGIPNGQSSCQFISDRRSFGLALGNEY